MAYKRESGECLHNWQYIVSILTSSVKIAFFGYLGILENYLIYLIRQYSLVQCYLLLADYRVRTFFRNANSWPMKDSVDPLDRWDIAEIAAMPSRLATSDIYGKLFYYLRGLFRGFCNRLSPLNVSF